MLDHHPEIAFNLESEFLVTRISEDGVFPPVSDYRAFLRTDRVFSHSHLDIREDLDFTSLLNDFLEQKRRRDGKKMVGATVHYQFRKLHRIWPSAKYIYMYRDGRDVARSVVEMGWAGNVYAGADKWLDAEVEWEGYREKVSSWIEVRYEDLVADPVGQLTRICRFMGVEYSDRMFDYAKHTSYRMPDVSLVAQWKRKLSRRDVQLLEERIGDRLVSRGYALSGCPGISVSAIEKACLRVHSKMGTLAFRVRRYGVHLVIRGLLARKLGLWSTWSELRRRFDLIDEALLK